jgi:hypothetical protein
LSDQLKENKAGREGERLGQMRNADINVDGMIPLKWILNK